MCLHLVDFYGFSCRYIYIYLVPGNHGCVMFFSFEVYSFNVLEKTIPERRSPRDLDALFFWFFFRDMTIIVCRV